jgi:RNA methyltransferase, TrmH family
MLVKSQVKYIQSLGHKKFRDAEGVFVAEGPKIVGEFLQSGMLRLVNCFATPDWLVSHEGVKEGRKQLFNEINEKELERISFHSTPNQVLAVFAKPVFNKPIKPKGLTLLLDKIQDPGNLGTILRTADWFGVTRIVCSEDTTDVFNPKVVQSAMGSLIRVEMIYTNLEDYIKANPDIPVYAGSLNGDIVDEKIKLSNIMLLIGNESKGVSSALESLATKRVRIPGIGGAESLNAAVAAGILLSRIDIVN